MAVGINHQDRATPTLPDGGHDGWRTHSQQMRGIFESFIVVPLIDWMKNCC
jgi:hypothetical protein